MDRVRLFAWGYFALFIAVVAVGYVPPFHDADGNLFGLFKLDLYDNSLHLASGIWAGVAAWLSVSASRLYFRLFGPLYFLDGVLGLITGSGYLDFGIFLYGPADLPLTVRFFANLPHLIIGGLAIWVGYRIAAPATRHDRVKRRWKLLLTIGGIAVAGALAPILYVEGRCRAPLPGFDPSARHAALLPEADRRPEARTWLTYPEWHIVYSAESLGRHLAARPPSSYSYWNDVRGFWSSYCLLNRATRGSPGAGDAKVMIYTIGISFSFEMAIKALYENSIGRLSEWIGGWDSTDDRYAARVQQIYGAFMHQTPWYRFPFGHALHDLWQLNAGKARVRHWERRFALSAEYGVKAGYAKAIGAASGATLGRDQLSLRFVAQATPAAIRAIDARLKPVASAGNGRTIVEAPRYAAFTDLLHDMAERRLKIVEIAGNDDIFVTFQVPDKAMAAPPHGTLLLALPLSDRPGWQRVGLSTKVPELLPLISSVERRGGRLEHVYDY